MNTMRFYKKKKKKKKALTSLGNYKAQKNTPHAEKHDKNKTALQQSPIIKHAAKRGLGSHQRWARSRIRNPSTFFGSGAGFEILGKIRIQIR